MVFTDIECAFKLKLKALGLGIFGHTVCNDIPTLTTDGVSVVQNSTHAFGITRNRCFYCDGILLSIFVPRNKNRSRGDDIPQCIVVTDERPVQLSRLSQVVRTRFKDWQCIIQYVMERGVVVMAFGKQFSMVTCRHGIDALQLLVIDKEEAAVVFLEEPRRFNRGDFAILLNRQENVITPSIHRDHGVSNTGTGGEVFLVRRTQRVRRNEDTFPVDVFLSSHTITFWVHLSTQLFEVIWSWLIVQVVNNTLLDLVKRHAVRTTRVGLGCYYVDAAHILQRFAVGLCQVAEVVEGYLPAFCWIVRQVDTLFTFGRQNIHTDSVLYLARRDVDFRNANREHAWVYLNNRCNFCGVIVLSVGSMHFCPAHFIIRHKDTGKVEGVFIDDVQLTA